MNRNPVLVTKVSVALESVVNGIGVQEGPESFSKQAMDTSAAAAAASTTGMTRVTIRFTVAASTEFQGKMRLLRSGVHGITFFAEPFVRGSMDQISVRCVLHLQRNIIIPGRCSR